MFDNSWRSSTRRCPLGRCPMDDGKFSSYRAERGRAVREGCLRVRRGDLRERYRTTRLPAPSARGSAEAPRVSPTAATGAAGRGLLHPELTAVEVLAVELRDGLIGLFRRGHLHETEAARATGVTIGHDGSRFDLAGRREHLTKPFRRCGERETADEQLLRHETPPSLLPRCEFMRAPEKRGRTLESGSGEAQEVPVNRCPGQTTRTIP